MGNMWTKFQVDWTLTSSKTTLTKNFNLKQNERTDERMHRPENITLMVHRTGMTMLMCDGLTLKCIFDNTEVRLC